MNKLLFGGIIINVTGVLVQYYVTCKRELWFFANQINMNYNNDDIDIGKFIHEKSYSRENKEIKFDNMVFDYVKNKNDLTIFEVKKSSSLTIGARYQLYFYLYNMRNCGKDIKGVLVYAKERKREEIRLTDEIIEDIKRVVNLKTPPKAIKKPYCKGCSFFELCMV